MTPREQIDKEVNLRYPSQHPLIVGIKAGFKEGAEYGYNLAIEKAGEVFAQKLIELCPEMLGHGGMAKLLENEFKQAIKL